MKYLPVSSSASVHEIRAVALFFVPLQISRVRKSCATVVALDLWTVNFLEVVLKLTSGIKFCWTFRAMECFFYDSRLNHLFINARSCVRLDRIFGTWLKTTTKQLLRVSNYCGPNSNVLSIGFIICSANSS